MTEFDRKLEVTNFLNNNGFDEVRISNPGHTYDFHIRVGYWGNISPTLVEEMELAFNVRVHEIELWDEDCGDLYSYGVEVVDLDTDYTLNELNDLDSNYGEDSYMTEAEFLHKSYLGDGGDIVWGVA